MSRRMVFQVAFLSFLAPVTGQELFAGAPSVEWQTTLGGDSTVEIFSVCKTADGGFAVTGQVTYCRQRPLRPSLECFTQVYLARLSSDGQVSWERVLEDCGANPFLCPLEHTGTSGRSVQETLDGGFIIAGYSTWQTNRLQRDAYLVKTDAQGNQLWKKYLGVIEEEEEAYCVREVSDGGLVVTGFSGGPFHPDLYLAKTDAEGNTLWERRWGREDSVGHSVEETRDGGFIVAGTTGGDRSRIYLIRTDSEGYGLWSRKLSGGSGDWLSGYSAQQTFDGGFVVVGSSSWLNNPYHQDIMVVKTDSSGWVEWQRTYSQLCHSTAWSIRETPDRGYVIAGSAKVNLPCHTDFPSMYLLRLGSAGDVLWEWVGGGNYRRSEVELTDDGGFVVAQTRVTIGGPLALIRPIVTRFASEGALPESPPELRVSSQWQPVAPRVVLEWDDVSDNETSFLLERRIGRQWRSLVELPAGVTSYVDDEVATGVEVCYRVGAANDVGYAIPTQPVCVRLESVVRPTWAKQSLLLPNLRFGDPRFTTSVCHVEQLSSKFLSVGAVRVNDGTELVIGETALDGSLECVRQFSLLSGEAGLEKASSIVPSDGDGYVVTGWSGRTERSSKLFVERRGSTAESCWRPLLQRQKEQRHSAGLSVVRNAADEGYVVCGWGANLEAGTDVMLVKLDSLAEEEWSRLLGGPGDQGGNSVVVAHDAGLVVAGHAESPETGRDVYLLKTDALGNLLWEKRFGGVDDDDGHQVIELEDHRLATVGTLDTESRGRDVYLLITAPDGEVIRECRFGGRGDDEGKAVAATADGGLIIAGSTRSFGLDFRDVYLLKTDSAGDLQWQGFYSYRPELYDPDRYAEEAVAVRGVLGPSGQPEGYIVAVNAKHGTDQAAFSYLLRFDVEPSHPSILLSAAPVSQVEALVTWTADRVQELVLERSIDLGRTWEKVAELSSPSGELRSELPPTTPIEAVCFRIRGASFAGQFIDSRVVCLQSLSVPLRRGDCNDDGNVDISDAVFSLGSLFLGDGDPGCDDACDSNDDGAVDISDAIATLGVLFLGDGSIPLPGMKECGVDPTEDEVGCENFETCP